VKTVAIVGGAGRIGATTAAILRDRMPDLGLVIVGRSRERAEAVVGELGQGTRFAQADMRDADALAKAVGGADCVVHAAGPFVDTEPRVLDAALAVGGGYVDVCDDASYTPLVQKRADEATRAGIVAVTGAGVYPGVTNLLAAEIVDAARSEGQEVEELDISLFAAGSGGAGPAILAATFALAARPANWYVQGERTLVSGFSHRRVVEFAEPVGKRAVYSLELPCADTLHTSFGTPTISVRFGIAPELWNLATLVVTRRPFSAITGNPERARGFVGRIGGMVDFVDRFVGVAVAVRVDAVDTAGTRRTRTYVHPHTVRATARMAAVTTEALLAGDIPNGLWVPELLPSHTQLLAAMDDDGVVWESTTRRAQGRRSGAPSSLRER
jgi:hypothetical protein